MVHKCPHRSSPTPRRFFCGFCRLEQYTVAPQWSASKNNVGLMWQNFKLIYRYQNSNYHSATFCDHINSWWHHSWWILWLANLYSWTYSTFKFNSTHHDPAIPSLNCLPGPHHQYPHQSRTFTAYNSRSAIYISVYSVQVSTEPHKKSSKTEQEAHSQ